MGQTLSLPKLTLLNEAISIYTNALDQQSPEELVFQLSIIIVFILLKSGRIYFWALLRTTVFRED